MIIKCEDINREELKLFHGLNEKQLIHFFEPEEGIFLAETKVVVERAIDAGYELLSMLLEDTVVDSMKHIIDTHDVPVYVVNKENMTQITGYLLTRGVICAFRRKKALDFKEIIKDKRRIVILEEVMNPTNMGAIFRSAAALNMDAVLLSVGCSDPLYRRSIRVSMGTIFQIPWAYIPDWKTNGVEQLHECGYKVVSMALHDDSVTIDDGTLNSEAKLAIVMGTEGEGLCDHTIFNSDYTVKIPMAHGVDSLNVAAASAVAFYQLGK